MIISGCIFQQKYIEENTEDDFTATYKGKKIHITTDHGFGSASDPWLKRFCIDVTDIKTGMYDVEAYKDFHAIKDAIRYALQGALLI